MAIDNAAVVRPQMPVHVYLQEAENTSAWMREDVPLFLKVGVKPILVETFERRIGALREAESQWASARNTRDEARQTYEDRSRVAFDLLDDSLRHMRFAFRRRPDLISRLPLPSDWAPRSRKFQMMNDLAVFGRENPGPPRGLRL